MINAHNKSLDELVTAINQSRSKQYNQFNRNPSVKIRVWGDEKEWYEAFISYNKWEDHWVLGVSFHGVNNQGKRYLDSLSAKAYADIKLLCIQIMAWADVGPSRIHLSIKRWEGQRHACKIH